MDKPVILAVDDKEDMREIVHDALNELGHQVITAGSVQEARDIAAHKTIDVLVTDLVMPNEDGMDLVRHIRRHSPSTQIVIASGYPDRERITISEELEVCSFVTKPFTVTQIQTAVIAALKRRSAVVVKSNTGGNEDLGLAGDSPYMCGLRDEIREIASSDFPVLIVGESGTGKEIVAQALHAGSSRSAERMAIVNCAAIPDHLEEAEFFGHSKGAFTGATRDRAGIFGSAQGSSLFLDEVAELSPQTQAKLLRVIENKDYTRVGESALRTADIRVISATNRNITDMIEEGSFRRDLFYRLSGRIIRTRPLREHREDVPLLVRHFLRHIDDPRCPDTVTPEVLDYLVNRDWPGNVREIKHFVNLLCHLGIGNRRINSAVLQRALREPGTWGYSSPTYKDAKNALLHDFDRDYFSKLLARHERNVTRASQETGIERANLIKKLKSIGMSAEDFRG